MNDELHQTLLAIHDRMQDSEAWHDEGLCRELENLDLSGDAWVAFDALVPLWPQYTGSPMFPVPSPVGKAPMIAFTRDCGYHVDDESARMWDRQTSPYAELRWQLLEWLIEETRP